MQYVWQHRLWTPSLMRTVDGERVEVIDPGLLNRDAGPDFFNAKVRIGGRYWVGNIELHVRASDWHHHGHDRDRAYDSVVLHVVNVSDARITRPDGELIPQLVMPCSREFTERYHSMVDNPLADLACADQLATLPRIYVTDWLAALAHERLFEKVDRILDTVKRLDGDWTSALYVTLARALGFGINSEPFERLAMAVPLRVLLKHRSDREAVEGLLLGHAGLLPGTAAAPDDYVERVRHHHSFLATKFNLGEPLSLPWRMARTRPQNFPHRRIAALAAYVCRGFDIASMLFEVSSVEQAKQLFELDLHGYWSCRYGFGAEQHAPARALSDSSISILIINVVVPLLYAYGQAFGSDRRMATAVELLQGIKPEINRYTTLFAQAGIDCRDALESQALIQLKQHYCDRRKCLYCRLGHRMLAAKVLP